MGFSGIFRDKGDVIPRKLLPNTLFLSTGHFFSKNRSSRKSLTRYMCSSCCEIKMTFIWTSFFLNLFIKIIVVKSNYAKIFNMNIFAFKTPIIQWTQYTLTEKVFRFYLKRTRHHVYSLFRLAFRYLYKLPKMLFGLGSYLHKLPKKFLGIEYRKISYSVKPIHFSRISIKFSLR